MANRNISHNIRKIMDIINYAEESQIEAVILSPDCEKAFERVERCAISGSLSCFSFGDKLIGMVILLYKSFEACTINSGEISNWFPITRGLLQGNPLSSSIFIIIVEIMSQMIRKNDKIKGIIFRQYEF